MRGRPRRQDPARHVTFYISEELLEWLTQASSSDRIAKGRLIEMLLQKERERRRAKGEPCGVD